MQLAAVKQDGRAIEYIKRPSEEMQLLAVSQNGSAIKYIDNPSEEVQLTAVSQDINAIGYIRNPCKEVKDFVKVSTVHTEWCVPLSLGMSNIIGSVGWPGVPELHKQRGD